ncbi:hypothetical protein LINPERPRIM_LOCUS266 [Linum perenne]
MVSELANSSHSDYVGVRFNGKNFALWEFSFRTSICGKGLIAYLKGTTQLPTVVAPDKAITTWEVNDVRVLSYLIGSVDPAVALTLRSYPSAAATWRHLRTTYSHVNTSQFFDLEYALAILSQGELSINDYYITAKQLWIELDRLSSSLMSTEAKAEILKERQRSHTLQFMMRLRPEFEQVHSRLVSEDKTDIDSILGELVRAETRFVTQVKLDNQSLAAQGSSFSVGKSKPQFLPRPTQGSPSSYGSVRCNFCQELGHPIALCKKRNTCTYCKKSGHIIF